MPTKLTVSIKSYSALLNQVRRIFIEGMQRIEMERVKTYWRTGETVLNEKLLRRKSFCGIRQNLPTGV